MSVKVAISWLIKADKPSVLRIERESFDEPWSEDDFDACARTSNCISVVAKENGRVVGFMVYELLDKSFKIINLAVAERSRRTGVGSALVEWLVSKMDKSIRPKNRITTIVRDKNLIAQLFFRSRKFLATKVMREFYEDGEDGYLFKFTKQFAEVEE